MRLPVDARTALIAILLLAGAARVAMLTLDFDQLGIDRDAYLGLAESLADGRGYTTPGSPHPTAYRPPVYPLLLCGVLVLSRLFGADDPSLGIAVLHLLAGVGTVWLTWRLAQYRLPTLAAMGAALLVAVDPLLVQYTARPMTETVCTLLVVLLLVQIERVRVSLASGESTGTGSLEPSPPAPLPRGEGSQTGGLEPSPPAPLPRGEGRKRGDGTTAMASIVPGLLAGLVFGLVVQCRPTLYVFGGLCGLLAGCWLVCRCSTGHRPGAIRQLAAVLCGAAVLVAPWVVRNWLLLGQPVLATTHGGYTLLLANNPVFYREVVEAPPGTVWEGNSLTRWQESLEQELAAEGIAPHDEPARDRWMSRRAFRNMAAAPGTALRAGWLKLRRLFSIRPLTGPAEGLRKWAALAAAGVFLVQYALVLLAVIRHRAAVLRQWWPALLLVTSFCLVHAVFWTNARMRAPLIPALTVLAASAVVPRSCWKHAASQALSRENR